MKNIYRIKQEVNEDGEIIYFAQVSTKYFSWLCGWDIINVSLDRYNLHLYFYFNRNDYLKTREEAALRINKFQEREDFIKENNKIIKIDL